MAARKKPRSAAQRAATRKMIAANRARAAHRRAPARRKRRAAPARVENPSHHRRRRRSNPGRPIVVYKGKRYRSPTKAQASAAGATLRYRRKAVRGNPIGVGAILNDKVIPAATGAGGALLLDIALGLIPLPATLKTGMVGNVVKVAGAIGMGMVVGKVAGRRIGDRMAVGAMTVQFYQMARSMLVGRIPGLSGSDGGYNYIGEYIGAPPMLLPDGTIGEYVGDVEGDDIGYIESGMQVGDVEGFETGVYR